MSLKSILNFIPKNKGSTQKASLEKLSNNLFETTTIDPRYLFFGQQHSYTIEYFQNTFGVNWTRIPVKKTPHYLFVAGDEKPYRNYLAHSWRYFYGKDIPTSEVDNKIFEFYNLIQDIKKSGTIKTEIELYWSVDGDMIIADGNHRAAIGAFLGLNCKAQIYKAEQQAQKFTTIPNETYGSANLGKPYQTIYNGRQVLLAGRRQDLITRIDAINSVYPLKGKTLLDCGSNIGMSSYLALRLYDMKKAHLVEASSDVTQAAIRLAVLLNSSNQTFAVGNLKEDLSNFLPVCDIGFCFSIAAHVKQIDNLAKLLVSNVKEAVFYETHEGRELEAPVAEKFKKHHKVCDLGTRQLFMLTNK